MPRAAIYARVSTGDQGINRQLAEAREYLDGEGYEEIEEYPEVVSGASEKKAVYEELLDDIESGLFDLVVVYEISRLSRLGRAEIQQFIQHCLENGAGVKALDVGLEILVDDPELQQSLYTMVANIMGDLAKIEHKQMLQRIESGVRAAQNQGKWTGRPPRGFTTDNDGYLRVEPEEFLYTREALARVERGESRRSVAVDTGIPLTTVTRLYNQERELYLSGHADDQRVQTAVDQFDFSDQLDDLTSGERGELEQRIRQIAREEIK